MSRQLLIFLAVTGWVGFIGQSIIGHYWWLRAKRYEVGRAIMCGNRLPAGTYCFLARGHSGACSDEMKGVASRKGAAMSEPKTATEIMMREYQKQTVERTARQATNLLVGSDLVRPDKAQEVFDLILSVLQPQEL